ncbi:hypothetical protein [Agrobacterium radiobacter]|uniref:hypothetical protein n=1 Tax=Agrobacterium radiobacter TaxID=362 RepID=UPI003F82FA00
MQISDERVKLAATEYLSHKGENPYRVTRRGAELWEDYAPAIRAALEVALSGYLSTNEKISGLLSSYFDLGVAEGREGRTHDTEAGDAQRVLSEIQSEFSILDGFRRENGNLKFSRMILSAERSAFVHLLEENEKDSQELVEIVKSFVDETVDYATRNNLGDPEKQHNVKWARSVIARIEERRR